MFNSLALALPPPVLRWNDSRHGWLAGLSLWPLLTSGLPSQSSARLPDATVQDSVLYYPCGALGDWLRMVCDAPVYSPGIDISVSTHPLAGHFERALPSAA